MLKVLELFAGIGAASKALANLGIEHEIVDAVEIDKYAIKAFNAIHGTNFEPQDITKWDKDIEVDLIIHGSPCQSFSMAGLQQGGDEGSGTQSSLMYESIRIIKKLRPKYVVWENVKNLLSKKHRHNFDAYLGVMEKLGYNNYYQVLNAKHYGVPQNRERVFTVSIRNDGEFDSYFLFPEPIPLEKHLSDILEDNVDKKYYLTDRFLEMCLKEDTGKYPRADRFKQAVERVNNSGVAVTVTTRSGQRPTDNFIVEDFYKSRPPRLYEENAPTLRASRIGLKVLRDNHIRRLTPLEAYRLMGFSDIDFDNVKAVGLSDAQLFKTAGNSIVVDVLMAIFKELYG